MKIAAVTITYNRLDLTKKTVESFNDKTKVDRHIFVDNGSMDGTREYLQENFEHILLDKNYGITDAFFAAVAQLRDFDIILKLDNDVETITEGIIEKIIKFYKYNGSRFLCAPVDLNLDPKFAPRVRGRAMLHKYNVSYVTHVGGAFQVIPVDMAIKLMDDYIAFKQGDYTIGQFCSRHGYWPVYLTDLQMRHIGLNQTSPNYVL